MELIDRANMGKTASRKIGANAKQALKHRILNNPSPPKPPIGKQAALRTGNNLVRIPPGFCNRIYRMASSKNFRDIDETGISGRRNCSELLLLTILLAGSLFLAHSCRN